MSKQEPENKSTPSKKDVRISESDKLVERSNAELDEEDLKRVTGGGDKKWGV
jgi:hypothetical protein